MVHLYFYCRSSQYFSVNKNFSGKRWFLINFYLIFSKSFLIIIDENTRLVNWASLETCFAIFFTFFNNLTLLVKSFVPNCIMGSSGFFFNNLSRFFLIVLFVPSGKLSTITTLHSCERSQYIEDTVATLSTYTKSKYSV